MEVYDLRQVPRSGNRSTATFNQAKSRLREQPPRRVGASHLKEQARNEATRLLNEAEQRTSKATRQIGHEFQRQVEESRVQLAARAHRLASAMDDVRMSIDAVDERTFAAAANALAARLDRAGAYLDDRDVPALVFETESFAKTRPMVVLGGALLAGFAVGRFFKSSAEQQEVLPSSGVATPFNDPR